VAAQFRAVAARFQLPAQETPCDDAEVGFGIHAKIQEGAIYSPEWERFIWFPLIVEAGLVFRRRHHLRRQMLPRFSVAAAAT
jgi:hypothetical protein